VITEISIGDVTRISSSFHPERTPVGPFDSREEAWEYARQIQIQYGNGSGSVEVSPLHPPKDLSQ
jgi:hypothetical protein